MSDEPQYIAPAHRALASTIVGAYLRRHQVPADQVAALIATVHQTLAELGKTPAEAVVKQDAYRGTCAPRADRHGRSLQKGRNDLRR